MLCGCRWRRTQDPNHLKAAVDAAVQKKFAKLRGGQYWQQYQQQQQDQPAQQQPRSGQALMSRDKYLAATAEAPRLGEMTVAGLRSFIQEVRWGPGTWWHSLLWRLAYTTAVGSSPCLHLIFYMRQ